MPEHTLKRSCLLLEPHRKRPAAAAGPRSISSLLGGRHRVGPRSASGLVGGQTAQPSLMASRGAIVTCSAEDVPAPASQAGRKRCPRYAADSHSHHAAAAPCHRSPVALTPSRGPSPRPCGRTNSLDLFRLKCASHHYTSDTNSTHFKQNNPLVCWVTARFNHNYTGPR
jgi:hypothetical protein